MEYIFNEIHTERFWIALVVIAILQVMPARRSRWSAALVCALVFFYEGQVFALFAALAVGSWAAHLERRVA